MQILITTPNENNNTLLQVLQKRHHKNLYVIVFQLVRKVR